MNKTNKFTNYIPAPINLTNTYYSRKPMEPFINFLEYNIKKKKYMWSQIYAHLLYGLTLSDPFPYF